MKYLYIFLCLALSACSDEPGELKSSESISGKLTLETSQANIPADNYSYAEVTATITGRLSSSDQIIFTSENSVFSNNQNTYTVNAASNQPVKVYVKYNKAERVKITAKSFGKIKEVLLDFGTAYPEWLLVNPDTGTLPSEYTSKSTITTNLVRSNGIVSEGQWISYRDSIATATGGSIGTFLNNSRSDSNGNATVHYWIQDTTFHGFVYIKAQIQTPNGLRKGENRIYID